MTVANIDAASTGSPAPGGLTGDRTDRMLGALLSEVAARLGSFFVGSRARGLFLGGVDRRNPLAAKSCTDVAGPSVRATEPNAQRVGR